MSDRLLEISDTHGHLHVDRGLVVLTQRGRELLAVPPSDLAAVVVAARAVTFTSAVVASLAERGACLVICDSRFRPTAMMLPLQSHHLQAERLRMQIQATKPQRKRLWQQIVQAKIKAQGSLLERLHGGDRGLAAMASRVRSGDPDNVEAQAARRYWRVLFSNPSFRRDRDAADQNRLLNYGYIVLRSAVARAICAVGLHPSIGVHHHSRYDAFCLVDDLMEPFRPVVDERVVSIVRERGSSVPLSPGVKRELVTFINERYELEGERRTLFDTLSRAASSMVDVLSGRRTRLNLPAPS